MKKILIFLIGLSISIAGCKKALDDNINGQSTDERLTEALTTFQDKLSSAPFGWKMVVFPEGLVASDSIHSAFAYHMKFSTDNRVTMVSDFNFETASKAQTSSYRLKALQRPTILFDTYSYASIPSNPDFAASNSPTGNDGPGWGSDFQFAFTDNFKELKDTIHLDGILHHSKAYMVRASQEEQDFYNSPGFANNMVLDVIQNYFKRVTLDGQSAAFFEMTPSLAGKGIELNYLSAAGVLKTEVVNYYYTPGSIQFLKPVTIGGETIKSIENISLNPATSSATCTVNGKGAKLEGAIAPLKINLTAPKKWLDEGIGGNYISSKGFHVNGVDDAFGLLNWKDSGKGGTGFPCVGFVYAPKAFWGIISIAAPLVVDADNHSLALPKGLGTNSSVFEDFGSFPGRVVFVGSNASGTDAAQKSLNLLVDKMGYYAIRKADGKNWDMVGARDAKTWIRWKL